MAILKRHESNYNLVISFPHFKIWKNLYILLKKIPIYILLYISQKQSNLYHYW